MSNVKILAQGKLPAAIAPLYRTPTGFSAIVRSIVMVNSSGSTRTVQVSARKIGGSPHLIWPKDYSLATGGRFADGLEMGLGADETIEGFADSADYVHYTIFGEEIRKGVE